jgi:hypothetical protein
MHDIFAFAEEVIVYLGEVLRHESMAMNESVSSSATTFHYDDSDGDKLEIFRSRCTAKTPSRALKGKTRMDYALEIFCFLRLLAGEPDLNHLPSFDSNSRLFIDTKYQRNLFEGLRQLLLCRWWNRIWVIQEVVVPKKVTIVYGSTIAPWDMFVNAARWDSRNRSSSTPLLFPHEYSTVLAYFARIILDIDRMRELWRDGERTALLPLLRRFSGRKASDDRDKVYALLGLVRNQTSIVPDYSLSVSAVFQATVLNIIKTTKSLAALAGDLGRKDRQDLPSWVPDWSAAYDDLDRRRAENTEKYSATESSLIYVQDEGAEEWSGIRQYLGVTGGQSDAETTTTRDYVKRFNDILGTSDWIYWLPDDDADHRPSENACLAAIDSFYTARGIAVCLQNHGCGVIRLAGLHVDTIAVTAETAFSDEVLLSVIRSWATLLGTHFLNKNYDRSSSGLGDAFRRTLCAGTVRTGSDTEGFTTRRIDNDDHGLIATWFLQGIDSQAILNPRDQWNSSWQKLFQDLGDHSSYMPPEPVSQSIDTTIRSATVRRTFFITDKGHIGLGPAKMRPGDHLYVLLGGQTPFILREAGSRTFPRMSSQHRLGEIKRQCFNVVGDCYTHGLMDGEAMREWRKIALNTMEDTTSRELLNQWHAIDQNWKLCKSDLFTWRTEEHDGGKILRRHVLRYERDEQLNLENDLERMIKLYGREEYEEKAKSCTSDLSQWKYQFDKVGGIDWMVELIKAARLKIKQIEKDIADAEYQMDEIVGRIDERDVRTVQKWHVYLV